MAEDFERETKKKVGDAKKNVRACRKQLHEKKLKKEREAKDMKHEEASAKHQSDDLALLEVRRKSRQTQLQRAL